MQRILRSDVWRSATGRVSLHSARVRRGSELPLGTCDGRDPAQRPRLRDREIVASRAELVDRLVSQPRLDLQGAEVRLPGEERAREMVGVELGRVDRGL